MGLALEHLQIRPSAAKSAKTMSKLDTPPSDCKSAPNPPRRQNFAACTYYYALQPPHQDVRNGNALGDYKQYGRHALIS